MNISDIFVLPIILSSQTFISHNKANMARLNLLEETRYEKLPVTVYDNQQEASIAVAGRIAALIR
ncbi:MAG: glucosamine-6-phosphate deaminase, partial [Mucilaginibacter sp.]|nr:glucosamine-6-phosphate deaminase [Mucilaginibacter sp.]